MNNLFTWGTLVADAVERSVADRCCHPTATYRLQFEPGQLGFRDAAAVVSYLEELGISHLYASPYLKTRSGSTHGYAVVQPPEEPLSSRILPLPRATGRLGAVQRLVADAAEVDLPRRARHLSRPGALGLQPGRSRQPPAGRFRLPPGDVGATAAGPGLRRCGAVGLGTPARPGSRRCAAEAAGHLAHAPVPPPPRAPVPTGGLYPSGGRGGLGETRLRLCTPGHVALGRRSADRDRRRAPIDGSVDAATG